MKHSRTVNLTHEQLSQLENDLRVQVALIIMTASACESWFVAILQDFLCTGEVRANMVLQAMTSTRARLQLLQNLAAMVVSSKRKVSHFNKLCTEFKNFSQIRNRLAHSIYHTSSRTSFVEYVAYMNPEKLRPGHKSFIEYRVVDKAYIAELRSHQIRGNALATKLWRFKSGLKGYVVELPKPVSQRANSGRIAKLLHLDLGSPQSRSRRGKSGPVKSARSSNVPRERV